MIKEEVQRGIWYMLLASFCFALVGAFTRILSTSVNSVELVFFRNLIGAIFIFASVLQRPLQQVGGKTVLLVFRGIIGTISLYTFFYSITQIGLAEAITYQQAYPLFIAVFSIFVMGEGLSRKEWILIILGFSGICFVFVPQMSGGLVSTRNHIIGLANAVLTAFAYMSVRGLSAYYDSRSIVLSFMVSGIILPLISMSIGQFYAPAALDFLVAPYIQPSGSDWLYILGLGLAALVGQVAVTKAFSYGKAGIIAAVGYSNIIFSVIFGILLGDAIPSYWAFVGIALIILSGVMLSYFSKKK